jgi:voltage-gated potassium channel
MSSDAPTMQNAVYLLMRRMRTPFIVLLCTYAVSVLGFVLIPGMDGQGRPWRMDFFHAFYFVSFMGSTIGFGEIPYPFTDAQRMWTTLVIYTTVIGWLYAIGAMLAVIQDPSFRRVVNHASFTRSVRRIRDSFYIVCGYGDTGSTLVRALAERSIRTVVIDIDQERINVLAIEDLPVFTPGLCADAADSAALLVAGLKHKKCVGVVSVTNDDHVNLTVAITSKLLAPSAKVICRAGSHDTEANMASFGTDHIINPFDTFAERFAMAIHSPSMFLLYRWITSIRHAPLLEPVAPPRGTWVLCGYGRFGKAVEKFLSFEGVRTTIIEAEPELSRAPGGTIIGRGTEADTLLEARIEEATGIIAGTDDDANNLSILLTAKDLNPDLFTVARQNQRKNDAIFEAVKADMIMQPGNIIARKMLALIMTPLLADFLRLSKDKDTEWANVLVSRISGMIDNYPPDTWAIEINELDAPAVKETLEEGNEVMLQHLCTDPRDRTLQLDCVVLLLHRKDKEVLTPDANTTIRSGDQILFCGHSKAAAQMAWSAKNHNVLSYIRTGVTRPSGYIWRWLASENEQS